jgi:hypothetical protein
MKQFKTLSRMLCVAALALGLSQAALATSVTESGTLSFSSYTVSYTNGTSYLVADSDVYNLGNALSGSTTLTFTDSAYNTSLTALAVIITTDANAALLASGSSSMASLIAALASSTTSSQVTSALSTYVTGMVSYVYGYNYLQSGTTSTLTIAANLTAGVTYYMIVVGGTQASSSYVPYADSSVTYTATVLSVPEPQSWATMLLGLGLVGGVALRRRAA